MQTHHCESLHMHLCVSIGKSNSHWGSIRSVNGGLYCLFQTQSDHEWSWIQFYQCHLRDQRAHWLPKSAEDPRSHLRILYFSACAVAVHPWKRTPPRWTLWSRCLQHEDSPMPHTLARLVKLNFEELSTVLSQVQACMNSRPLVALPPDDTWSFLNCIEAHPNMSFSYTSIYLLCRFQLCQLALIHHIWKRWSTEYKSCLQKVPKWHLHTKNIAVDDVALMCDDRMLPTKWPLARITEVFPGKDNIIYVWLNWRLQVVPILVL